MRAVVIGGSGQIGSWLLSILAERGHETVGTYATVPYPSLVHLDAADLSVAASWVKAQKPEVVFCPAGFTWVDGCERDPARNRSANVEQPLNLARASADVGARFVHFSTDYLFDGRSGPYAEDATPDPLNAYGRAKLEAEQSLLAELNEAVLIVRTCWVYGPERQGKNFAYQVVKTLREGRTLSCPSDQTSTPSYGPDVARATVLLAETGQVGVIHVAGPDAHDRPTFARAIATAFALDPALVVAKPTAELGQGAARPLRGGLTTTRLRECGISMRSLDAAFEDFRARSRGTSEWADPRTA
jgi:dTDP-4-dehydrorhamnose reductase